MNTQLIPVFSGELSGTPAQLADARLLHEFLEVGKDFSTWIKARIEEYGFTENQDFLVHQIWGTKTGRGGNRKAIIDYHLTLDMAKELGMIERNEKGRQIRRYFLEMERKAITHMESQLLENTGPLPTIPQQPNSVTLTLGENSKPKRYLVTQGESDLTVIKALPDDTFVGTREQVIRDLKAGGFIVLKKSDLL